MTNDECRMMNDLPQLREAAVTAREGRDECLRLLTPAVTASRDTEIIERFAALCGYVRELDLLRKQEMALIECGRVSAECGMSEPLAACERMGVVS